jgi:hypothetical protein
MPPSPGRKATPRRESGGPTQQRHRGGWIRRRGCVGAEWVGDSGLVSPYLIFLLVLLLPRLF